MILSGWESVFFWIFSIAAILAGLFNRPPQVAAALIFSILLVLGLLFATKRGYEGLQKRDSAKLEQAAAVRQAQQQDLPPSATGVSRVTKETERVGGSLYTYAS